MEYFPSRPRGVVGPSIRDWGSGLGSGLRVYLGMLLRFKVHGLEKRRVYGFVV